MIAIRPWTDERSKCSVVEWPAAGDDVAARYAAEGLVLAERK